MVQILYDRTKEVQEQPWLVPDIVWTNDRSSGRYGFGDFELAEADEANNSLGLAAFRPFETAVILCLMCDRRRPADTPDFSATGERRGWFGDTFDILAEEGEEDMGSLLWTLERAPITDQTGITAVAFAQEALATLIRQGLVDHFEITYQLDPANGFLGLDIKAFATARGFFYSNTIPVVTNV